jgi:hypothetical protein
MAEQVRPGAENGGDMEMHVETYRGFTHFTFVSVFALLCFIVSLSFGAIGENWGVAAVGIVLTPVLSFRAFRNPNASVWSFLVLILFLVLLHFIFW